MRFWNTKRAHTAPAAHAGRVVDQADVRAAYERGRREERARRHRSPLLMALLGVTALVGGTVLVASALHGGSFARGGASVDHGLSVAARQAGPTLRDAGHALKEAGGDAKAKADQITAKGG